MDAMITFTAGGRRRTYAFKGEDYWQLTDLGVAKGYPKKIAEKWGGVPDNLDDALVYAPHSCSKEILFFFKVGTCQFTSAFALHRYTCKAHLIFDAFPYHQIIIFIISLSDIR